MARGMAQYLIGQVIQHVEGQKPSAAAYYMDDARPAYIAPAPAPREDLQQARRERNENKARSLDSLVTALKSDMHHLADDLLGAPNRALSSSKQLRYGAKGSLLIDIGGARRGLWKDFESDEGGGPLQLIQRERGGSLSEAIQWGYRWAGIDPDGEAKHTPRPRDEAQEKAAEQQERARRISQARTLSEASVPVDGTVAEVYLIQVRGISKPEAGWPDSVRFHPPSRSLLVRSTLADGSAVGVQRVYLDEAGHKAKVDVQKRTTGSLAGSVVRLPGDPKDPLILAEGAETGLSLWRATGHETWIGIGSLANFRDLPTDRIVILARDDDAAGSKADLLLRRVTDEWIEAGVDLRLATPWQERRGDKSDFNDVMLTAGPESIGLRITLAQPVDGPKDRQPPPTISPDIYVGGAQFRPDTHYALARLLGINPRQAPTEDQIANLMNGMRADGQPIPGKQYQAGDSKGTPLGYVDLTWNPDKSVSLAWAMAPTERERTIIYNAHADAVDSAMWFAAGVIGRVRKGPAGRDGSEAGHLTWISFDHSTARPTLETKAKDAQGREYTEFVPLEVAGDPHLHRHTIVMNAALTDTGRVGSMNLNELDGKVKLLGAYYQAHLATNLRKHGIEVEIDQKTGSSRITAIPDFARREFSKRTEQAREIAKDMAAKEGIDWDALPQEDQVALAKRMSHTSRRSKDTGESDRASWAEQAERMGWNHASVLRPGEERGPLPEVERHRVAAGAAMPLLDAELQRRAVITDEDAQVIATRGMIVSGIVGRRDIYAVTKLFRQEGVVQNGERTALIWAPDPQGRNRVSITTALHESQETELIDLVRRAAADGSGTLNRTALDQAVARSPLDFTTRHGVEQLAAMQTVASSGRLAVVIGAAGSGKTAMLTPLVDGWRQEGRNVVGLALAWRQTEALGDAGIKTRRALSNFLHWQTAKGGPQIRLRKSDVVVVDEVGQVGTRQLLDLMRLQAQHKFSLVMLGDPKQCQSIEAGPVIDLLQRALGEDRIPQMLITIRQQAEREVAITNLFRDGRAEEALRMKIEDGTAQLVPGSYKDVVEHVAALWRARMEANAGDPDYRLSVMAPTNGDAMAISAAIRETRRARGEIGEDAVTLRATDQRGEKYDLPLAAGDRVRLFDRVNARIGESYANIGSNGSVLEVMEIDGAGVTLRDRNGRDGVVKWESLRDKSGEARIRLAHGDVLTIDAGQGISSTEHIDAMPGGTAAVNGFKSYVSKSRHRRATYTIISDGAERKEIAHRRPAGDPRPVREGDVWENAARNLSRQTAKESATAMLDRLHNISRSAIRAAQEAPVVGAGEALTAWQRSRVVEGLGAAVRAVQRAGEVARQVVRRSLRPTPP
jgi:hypothetical protein